MLKKLATTVLFGVMAVITFAQLEPEKKRKGRPDIPGTFMVEYGFNWFTRPPQDLNKGFWGSRTLNLYYQYDKQFGSSQWSVHSGIGFGLERYKLQSFVKRFSNDTIKVSTPTLHIDASGNTRFISSGAVLYGDTTRAATKSMFITNYVDVPIEFRFTANPNDPAKSFKAAIGGRFGVLLNAQTKLKYREDGEVKKLKDRQDFNLNQFRYGAYGRVGVGNVYLSFYYNFSDLFKAGKGPDGTATSNYTITLSLVSF
ncbi:MAG: hypothetical protein HRU69_08615 [Flammeovirgaceae bacterium]|nr:MAG: hypothetical protein HRU69_08615 [Flammeovirgaceae bacterium]